MTFALKHGRIHSTEYHSWQGMIQRCTNPNKQGYNLYGGRGIKVCERWRASFTNFLEDVGTKPSPTHSLDRYPNKDGDYEPGNVRWATPSEQQRNTNDNHMVTINGRTQCIQAWADESGLSKHAILYRSLRGWPPEKILNPSRPRRPRRKDVKK